MSKTTVTLPSGMTLQGEDDELWAVYFRHASTALSEHLCPQCSSPLKGENRDTCYDPRHRPVRWHLCARRVGESYLDVPGHLTRSPFVCEACGQPSG